jgi:uncharacterized damage-inducible protein DinB
MMSDMKPLAHHAEWVANSLANAISYVPKGKQSWKPAATTRSAQDILAHATYWNLYFTRLLQGQEPLSASEEAWTGSTKELKDSEQARKLAEQSGKDFVAAIGRLSDRDLTREVELPWGRRTLYQVVLDNYWHLTYHFGQLCYIQTALGDTQDHI